MIGQFFFIILVSPFLIGQALWVASRFTPLMSAELLTRWVKGPYESKTATGSRTSKKRFNEQTNGSAREIKKKLVHFSNVLCKTAT